jgi:hypothetical protein
MNRYDENLDSPRGNALPFKLIATAILTIFLLVGGLVFFNCLVGHNDLHHWQVIQSPLGEVTVRDTPGYYVKGWSSVWTYPRAMDAYYGKPSKENPIDDSIKAGFNDGGTADVSSYVRIILPVTREQRLLIHQRFNANPENLASAVRAHLTNCVNAAGPVMSASENQASRKSEFNQIVEDQLSQGLFKMRRTTIELDDLSTIEEGKDENGNKIAHEKKARVQATEIVRGQDGRPIVIQESPLKPYGISIDQFSITHIDYDATTLTQFSAKKTSYLAAEQAKAERQQEVQQRLMIEEKGRRQVAEVQAAENQKKEQAVIQANQKAEVAIINKTEAVTAAQQKTEVAEQSRMEAEKLRDIAAIKTQTAELEKKAAISRAEAQQKSIELGGGISEKERILAEIDAKARVGVADALSKIPVPGVVFNGGGGTGGSSDATGGLINIMLLRSMGVLPADNAPFKTAAHK